jgi:hypothetical protein
MSKRECWLLKFDDGKIQVQLNKPESYSFYNQQTKESRKLIECVQVVDKSELSDLQRRFDELLKHADAMAESFRISNAYTIFTIQNPDEKVVLSNFQSFRATLGESK